MSVYGTNYFIDNTIALEEAFNNELNNFDIMMENYSIEVITESNIIDKIKELWRKFKAWFKEVKAKIKKRIKEFSLEKLLEKAKNNIDNDSLSGTISLVIVDNKDSSNSMNSITACMKRASEIHRGLIHDTIYLIKKDFIGALYDEDNDDDEYKFKKYKSTIDKSLLELDEYKLYNYGIKLDLSERSDRQIIYNLANENHYCYLYIDSLVKKIEFLIDKTEKDISNLKEYHNKYKDKDSFSKDYTESAISFYKDSIKYFKIISDITFKSAHNYYGLALKYATFLSSGGHAEVNPRNDGGSIKFKN